MKNKTGATSPFELEPGYVSVFQGTTVFITFIISTIDIFVPYLTVQRAGRDGWISVFLMLLLNLPLVATMLALIFRFPRRNIIEYSQLILGVWPGRLVGLLYLFFILMIGVVTAREFMEIMSIAFLRHTPNIVFGILIVALTAYTARSGLEVINRVNGILLPLGMFFLVFVGFTVLPRADLSRYLPILENGFKPPLNASLILLAQVAEGFMLSWTLPLTPQPGKIINTLAWALPVIGGALLLGTISIPVFGVEAVSRLTMPALELSRVIEVPGLPRSDILIMAGWYAGIYVKLSAIHYMLSLLSAQFAGLKSYKSLISPIGIIILSLSMLMFSNTEDLLRFIGGPYTYFLLTFEFALPFIMLIISWLRRVEEKEAAS